MMTIGVNRSELGVTTLGTVVEASINEVFIFDEQSLRFVHVNEGARRNLGYSMDELAQMTPLDIKPEITAAQFENIISPLRDGSEKKTHFRTIHKRKDGSHYPVDVHLQFSVSKNRKVFLAIMLDISDFKKTEDALMQAETFLNGAPDPTLVVDTAGMIRFASPRVEDLLGYPVDALKQMNVDELIPENLRSRHSAHRAAFAASGENRVMGEGKILHARHKDGHLIPVEVSLNPIWTVDEVLISASIRDTSEQVKVNQALREARDVAEAATLAKTRFLAAASHDLRQPLQSLNLYLTALLQVSVSNPKAQEIGEKMNMSLSGMNDLLDALLDLSQLEKGTIKVKNSVFSVQSLLNSVSTDFSLLARKKGLKFICEGSEDFIRSDARLLLRIVENFVANAIRYTDKGHVKITCENIGDHVRISVNDTGIGISDQDLETVFDEYYKLENPHRDQNRGLGLGLSVVKHIAKLLGLKVEASSVFGKGSAFSVCVPFSESSDVLDLSDVFNKPVEKGPPVILCIDDDDAVLDSLSTMLDLAGYDTFIAGNDHQALAHVEAGLRPDIIVSDYRLPGSNGAEIIKAIRGRVAHDIPAIIMSGDTSGIRVKQSGLDKVEVLSKPVHVKNLLGLIEIMANE